MQVSLTPRQIDYALTMFEARRDSLKALFINCQVSNHDSVRNEADTLTALIEALNHATHKTVELPVLPESLG